MCNAQGDVEFVVTFELLQCEQQGRRISAAGDSDNDGFIGEWKFELPPIGE
jgi:hypothetical protein